MSGFESFTPVASLVGGVMIGASASALLLLNGKVAGISGICGGLLTPKRGEIGWRALFVLGLVAGGLALCALRPGSFPAAPTRPFWVLPIAGLLVGFGTRLGSGCTSGHGVCGMSRFSLRSIVATLTFMAAGAATVWAAGRILGGGS